MAGSDAIVQVTVDEVKASLEAHTAQVVDVRPSFDFAGGRIPGSLSFPAASLAGRADLLDTGMRTIFVSEDGEGVDAAIAAARRAGFSDVANLAGGYDAWLDADYPTHTIDDGG